jgi:hypothetical protein
MSPPNSELQPLLVSVRKARELLGGIGNNKFWQLAKLGELELVGTERKRFVVVTSLEHYVAKLREVANAGRAAESRAEAGPLAQTLPAPATRLDPLRERVRLPQARVP